MARILIVDDSPTLRRMLIACLAPLGHPCDEAATGLEAVEKLTVAPYDLVFLDINMPDMNGVEVAEFLHRHEALARIPVAVVTTRDEADIKARLAAAGVRRHILKPFVPDQVVAAARDLLGEAEAP